MKYLYSGEQICISFLTVRQRQEEKRQQEETNRVKERKRKREKYAEKVLWCKEVACVGDRARRASDSLLCGVETFYAKAV